MTVLKLEVMILHQPNIIFRASMCNSKGDGLSVSAKADIHSRSWIEGDKLRWLLANYSNGGSERFIRSHVNKDDRPLKKADRIKGKVV